MSVRRLLQGRSDAPTRPANLVVNLGRLLDELMEPVGREARQRAAVTINVVDHKQAGLDSSSLHTS
jgi:hypothetical protein